MSEHARRIVELENGQLRVVAVADTHSNPHPQAKSRIAALSPDLILHGGDIGNLNVLDALREIAPVIAVRGNIDGHAPGVPDSVAIELMDHGQSRAKLLLLHIAVYGPKLRAEARKLAVAEAATLVVCGHSHVPFAAKDRGLTVFNPGSIGPRRFSLPIVFGVIDVGSERISVRHVDCETGETWLPPKLPRMGAPAPDRR
jgi:putative phosphoesterase